MFGVFDGHRGAEAADYATANILACLDRQRGVPPTQALQVLLRASLLRAAWSPHQAGCRTCKKDWQ